MLKWRRRRFLHRP